MKFRGEDVQFILNVTQNLIGELYVLQELSMTTIPWMENLRL